MHGLKDILETRGLTVETRLRGVDLRLGPGEGIGVVGRSGAGKSTLARALVGLEPGLSGSLRFEGRELVGAPRRAWGPIRSRVQLVWQDAATALDPHLVVRRSIGEARLLAGKPALGQAELEALVGRVALDPALLEREPGALSGGQRQRAAFARALAAEPGLIVADEVTSALDRPVAWTIVDLLRTLRDQGIGVLMIAHDLSLLAGVVDEVIVLDAGEVVERGPAREVLARPQHPATRALVDAAPRLC